MCGGVYEEDFTSNQNDAPGTDTILSREEECSEMESGKRRIIEDKDKYVYPGSDPQT